ncbi:uncharacterized protein LOC131936182 [Physella acuta]|uniref:uncharacterized protein LOC131936182 n=1 Tax=Physella acuta TaxID=109671 RepID=UPI0027DCF2E0|nr:uncharacterized protein LOC131936182 [Physella acuta]
MKVLICLVFLLGLSTVSCKRKYKHSLVSNAIRLMDGLYGDTIELVENQTSEVPVSINFIPVQVPLLQSQKDAWFFVNMSYNDKPDGSFLMTFSLEKSKWIAEFVLFKDQYIFNVSISVLQEFLNKYVTEDFTLRKPRCTCILKYLSKQTKNIVSCLLPKCLTQDKANRSIIMRFDCSGLYFLREDYVVFSMRRITKYPKLRPAAMNRLLDKGRICPLEE